jgi:hypothetical protein
VLHAAAPSSQAQATATIVLQRYRLSLLCNFQWFAFCRFDCASPNRPEILEKSAQSHWNFNFADGAHQYQGEGRTMTITVVNDFISGAIAMGFATLALLFFSFWRRSRTGLFRLFGIAFALLAIERAVLVFVDAQDEFKPFVYLIRLTAFLVIIAGIVVQNRRSN